MSINSDMDAAIIALAKANERLAAARMRFSEANRDECTALNEANKAQQRIDEILATMRKTADRGTDWARKRESGESAPTGADKA